MEQLTEAQREVLKTLPASYLAKLREAVSKKRELDEQWAAEEERVEKLRELVQDWKEKHEKAFQDAMASSYARLADSEQGATQSQAHVDKTKQVQLGSLDEQIGRRKGELKLVDTQVQERQAQINSIREAIAEVQSVMERKQTLVTAFTSGATYSPRIHLGHITRRPTMTIHRGISGSMTPTLLRQSVVSHSPRSPSSARASSLLPDPDELAPSNTPETADPISKIDIETVPARVVLEALQELILEPSHFLMQHLSVHARPNEQEKLARAWVDIFEANGEFLEMLKSTVAREVHNTLEIGTLFRSNSMASRMMSIYSRGIGMPYLQSLLKPKIDAIIAASDDLEIDTLKIAGDQVEAQREQVVVSAQTVNENITKLTEHAIDFIQTIFAGKAKAPLEYYKICAMLRELVSSKFPSQWKVAIGGYLFLRLMCPCIFCPPEDFGTNFDSVSAEAKRTLVLVSKILQNLANFQPKFVEELMAPFSSFVTFNMPAVEVYFEYMSADPPPTSAKPTISQEGPIRQRLREVLAVASTNHAKLDIDLRNATLNPLAEQEFIQLWSFSKAPKLLSLYNKITVLGTMTGMSEDSSPVISFINMIVPPQPTVSPVSRASSTSAETPSATTPVASLSLGHLTNPPEPPHVLLAILETSTRLDFSGVENSELAAALYPIWEYRSRTAELVQQALAQFLDSPTRSNRRLADSVGSKVLTHWSERLLGTLIKKTLMPLIANLVGSMEVQFNHDALLKTTGNFLDAILAATASYPDPLFQVCHRMSTSPRLGIAAAVELVLHSIWVQVLEDPDWFAAASDRGVRKALLMIADLITLISNGSRDRQNAAIDTFITQSTSKAHATFEKWLQSPAPASEPSPDAKSPWSVTSQAIDHLRIFLGKNMSSVSTILDNNTTQNRYIKFTVADVLAQMITHTVAKGSQED